MEDKINALRAVIEAARKVAATPGRGLSMMFAGTGDPAMSELLRAVAEMDILISATATELLPHTKWMDVREGDQVKAPNGEWYPVVASVMGSTPAVQKVSLLVNGVAAGPYDRPAEGRVDVRREKNEMNAAIDVLAATFGEVRAVSQDWS